MIRLLAVLVGACLFVSGIATIGFARVAGAGRGHEVLARSPDAGASFAALGESWELFVAPGPVVESSEAETKPGWSFLQPLRWASLLALAQVIGVLSSIHALMSTRTSQGTIAWIVSLNALPVVSVPAYWVFGRTKFQGYVKMRRNVEAEFRAQSKRVRIDLEPFVRVPGGKGASERVGACLAEMPYLGGNRVDLLVDGNATFDSILAGIERAREHVLVQFYIVHDDGIGRDFKERLVSKCREGVPVWFLYDEVGSHDLPTSYLQELRDAGVSVSPFQSTRGRGNRFQINFRNHRKIVVVDGRVGWVGGHNVGDEYLGRDPEYPNWRDTHVRIEGPSALQLQLSFVEDWRWATGAVPQLGWIPRAAEGADAVVLILPSGPADRLETASLMYQQVIHSARTRVWIASPYFVPDGGVLSALHLAAMRGVDVKVILPDRPDSRLVYYSAYAFADALLESKVEILRYEPGFLHQKVFLVDDRLAGVGTANLDNRSFRLNFEVTALLEDEAVARRVGEMLEVDIGGCRRMTLEEVRGKPWWFRVLARASFLAAPIE